MWGKALVTVTSGFSRSDVGQRHFLVDYLKRTLAALRRSVTSEQLHRIDNLYQRPACPQINYDDLAEAFTYKYYLPNYRKNVSAFREDRPPIARSLVDLGSGSGASTLAYLSVLNDLAPTRHQVHVWLVDRSHEQLHLAKRIFDGALPYLPNLRVKLHYEATDACAWAFNDRVDVVLASHVLTENHEKVDEMMGRMVDLTVEDGRLYVLERSDDSIWDAIDATRDGLLPWRKHRAGWDVRQAGSVHRSTSFDSTTFLTCRLPRTRRLVEAVSDYFQAWRDQDPAALASIFSPTARYVVSPSKQPIVGLDRLITYWETEVVPQVDPRPRILKSAYSDDAAFVEWTSDFHLRNSRISLVGGMVFEIDHSTGLVDCLREWFRRAPSPGG